MLFFSKFDIWFKQSCQNPQRTLRPICPSVEEFLHTNVIHPDGESQGKSTARVFHGEDSATSMESNCLRVHTVPSCGGCWIL